MVSEGESRPGAVRLSSALAQRIVDELAPALEANLNLMDEHGFIIASRDASRVGTLHPGAREAAARNVVVSVHAGSARPGERPGVNLPLEHRGRVIGVVGITGVPDEVRPIAAVLMLTIGLLVEREAEAAGESQRDAADRDILARLVYGSRPEDAYALLEQRLPTVPQAWVLAAAIPSRADQGIFGAGRAAALRAELGALAVVGSLRGVLWLLKGALRPEELESFATAVSERVPDARVVHSGICESPVELTREAGNLALLSVRGEAFGELSSPIHVRALRPQLAAAQLPMATATGFAEVIAGLTAGERETLREYLASGNAAELARSGYTHRNTVHRRMQSIAERTGYDLRIPEQAAVLVLALAAEAEVTLPVHNAP